MSVLYTISIYVYLVVIRISALFNPKAKLWISGRKHIFKKMQSEIGEQKSKIIWLHCASLGEFEQGRPLIERIKNQEPGTKILLTFFSPSGYEIRKNYSGAGFIFYLPIDTPKNARKFIDIIKPSSVFFIKYEFWYNYLNQLKKLNIPTYLVSGIFREDHYFFKPMGSWFRSQLNCFTHFYLQDEKSEKLLNSIGYKNTTISGDTRFDRVSEIAKNVQKIELIEQFIQDKKILIVGSSWEEDEKIVSSLKLESLKLIIAPHEIDEDHIQAIIQQFSNSKIIRYSQANAQNVSDATVLIIDNIGMLSSLYQYGTIAYIGGGFSKGIHNILEAATFGLPVIFGPNYHKFAEAKDLIKLGGAFPISSTEDFQKTIVLLNQPDVLKIASLMAKNYISSHTGASERILETAIV